MGYSADIELWLEIDDNLHNMGQIGPEWFILRDDVSSRPRNAVIIIRIDDSEDRIPVFLPAGTDPSITKTRYEKLVSHIKRKPLIQQQFGWAFDF
jgi:hypothetical protein